VLDGTDDAERRARSMLFWDVNNGVSRRAWGGNDNATFAIQRYARMRGRFGFEFCVAVGKYIVFNLSCFALLALVACSFRVDLCD
jgi:hypothetical protein